MRILDRYILGSIVKIFFGSILTFCFLYILIDSTSQLDEFIDRKVSIDIIAKYYFYSLPSILVTAVAPVASLIAVLFTFSGLNNNNEVIALRSSGLNFWQITKPALYFGLIISALVFWTNERFVPQAAAVTKEIREQNMELEVVRLRKRREKITNLTFYGLQNRLFFIDKFNPAEQELNGITIIKYDEDQNIQEKIVALKGHWASVRWKFFNVQVTTYSEEGINIPAKIKVYKEKLMDIDEKPDDFLRQRVRVTSMNIKELREYINRFSSSGASRALNNLRVDLYQKMAFPFQSFIIVMVGLPFALMVKGRKGATFTSAGLAIIICFLFFVLNSVAIALGKGNILPPILSAFISPIIFIGIAITAIESNFAN